MLQLYIHISTFKCVLISFFIVGNKIFCFFKKQVFFRTRVHFKRGVNFSKILRRVAHKGGGGSGRFRLFGGAVGERDEVNISGWGWYPGGHYVCAGFLYTNTEIFPLFHFKKVSRNASFPLLSSFIVNLIFWWRLLMW